MTERNTSLLTRERAIELLLAQRAAIESLGVRRLALFGSVARGEAQANSDVDVLVEFDPSRKTFRNFMTLVFLLEDLFARRVEVVTTQALSPVIGPRILREAIDVLRAA